MSDETRTPFFEKRAPRFTWRELAVMGAFLVAGATAFATYKFESIETRRQVEELKIRQDRIEHAIQSIPTMQTDIAWIKAYLKGRHDIP